MIACAIGTVLEGMDLAFALETASGKQLDVVGATVGASRALPYTSSYVADGMLPDGDYRDYIRAKILLNMWDGTNGSLPQLWQTVYPSLEMSYVDNQDMTMTVTIRGEVSNALSELIQAGMIVPRPMGVSQTIIVNSGSITPATVQMGTGLVEYGNADIPHHT